MRGNLQKVLSTLALTIPVFIFEPAQAAILNWDVNFFDDNGAIVGNGEFTSDTGTTQVEILRQPSVSGLPPLKTIDVNNFLTSFSANVQGRKVDLATSSLIRNSWLDADKGLQQIRIARNAPPVISDDWDFQEGGRPNPYGQLSSFDTRLALQGNESQPGRLWAGTWEQSGSDDSIFSSAKTTGRWEATVRNPIPITKVPEATTVLGIAVFGAVCLLKKSSKHSAML
jgi:hypothetical protein